MQLNNQLKTAIAAHPDVLAVLQASKPAAHWNEFTRTQFNAIAKIINKNITHEVIKNPELVEQYLVIGKLKVEKEIFGLRKKQVSDFISHLSNFSPYQVYNWISGKTLQSYWNGGEAKEIKINALLTFLKIPFSRWAEWITPAANMITPAPTIADPFFESSKASLAVVRKYYTGNYFLYYQKTDGSRLVIKTPFVLKEADNGDVLMHSVSEGHRYSGRVMGVRDGCLYINCQNLDFEEMEQYVFNIGLETKPEVLFGVSNTVSVKDRLAVGLKNILVKQPGHDDAFAAIPEVEIPFDKKYSHRSEEAVMVQYIKQSGCNIISSRSCCDMDELQWVPE
jgi:hypothetical protein